MKSRIATIFLLTLLAAAASVPSAGAATRKIIVTPVIGYADVCRAETDQIRFSYTFKAKIKRKNAPRPKKVTIKYSVKDDSTGALIVRQTLTLKPRSYFRVGAQMQYAAEQKLKITVDASFKSPLTGKTLKSHSVLDDAIPSVADLDAADPPLPACPAAVG